MIEYDFSGTCIALYTFRTCPDTCVSDSVGTKCAYPNIHVDLRKGTQRQT